MNENANRKVVLFVAMVGAFITPFMGSAINVALRSIGTEFALSAVAQSWVATSYILAAAMFLAPFGRLADIFGRKRIYLYGMIIYTISSALCAFANSDALLIAFRVFQGIGSAMIFGTSMAILTSVFPAQERGKILGLNVGVTYIGLSAGPLIGGLLTEHFGWRSIFIVNIPFGLAIIAAILLYLKGEWTGAKGEKFDVIGSIIYAVSIFGIIYGFSLIPKIEGGYVVFVGIIGIALFIFYEMRIKSPIIHMDLFRGNKVFLFSSLAALISYSATAAVAFLLSQYLQYIKGFSPFDAGMVLMAQPIIQAIFSPAAGKLSDRIQPRKVASIGMALTTLGLFVLTFLNQGTHIVLIILGLIFLGFGFALFSSPNTNAIMSSVDKKFYGVSSGILGTMRLVGQALSMGIAILVISIHIGGAQIIPSNYPSFVSSMKTTFIILTVLCFAGIFASLSRGKLK